MSFKHRFEEHDDVVSDINMTPLVDVMLVLLIIFIITVPVLTHSIKLDLPQARSTPNLIQPETITLSVTRDGAIHWNETIINTTDLEHRLHIAAAQQPQPEIHILGDRKVEYEHVINTMAAAQRAGILKLGFVTEPAQ